jgi:hypothetical protein
VGATPSAPHFPRRLTPRWSLPPTPQRGPARYRIWTSAGTQRAAVAAREEAAMSKLKIEHGASKVNLVQLKTNIEDGISQDIDLMASWSDNERRYIVNELLRFALTQDEDFLKYKASLAASTTRPVSGAKSAKPSSESGLKTDPSSTAHA